MATRPRKSASKKADDHRLLAAIKAPAPAKFSKEEELKAYRDMMLNGGRSIEGNRSKSEWEDK